MIALHNASNGSESQDCLLSNQIHKHSNTTQIIKVFAGYLSSISTSAA